MKDGVRHVSMCRKPTKTQEFDPFSLARLSFDR